MPANTPDVRYKATLNISIQVPISLPLETIERTFNKEVILRPERFPLRIC